MGKSPFFALFASFPCAARLLPHCRLLPPMPFYVTYFESRILACEIRVFVSVTNRISLAYTTAVQNVRRTLSRCNTVSHSDRPISAIRSFPDESPFPLDTSVSINRSTRGVVKPVEIMRRARFVWRKNAVSRATSTVINYRFGQTNSAGGEMGGDCLLGKRRREA